MYAQPCTIFTEKVYYDHNYYRVLPVQPLAFNPEPTHVSWERLEAHRLQRLGIPNRYSRHCNIVYNRAALNRQMERQNQAVNGAALLRVGNGKNGKKEGKVNNSLAPFFTNEKRTCGFFFSRDTDNRKRNFGIPASDLVAWRSATNPVQ